MLQEGSRVRIDLGPSGRWPSGMLVTIVRIEDRVPRQGILVELDNPEQYKRVPFWFDESELVEEK